MDGSSDERTVPVMMKMQSAQNARPIHLLVPIPSVVESMRVDAIYRSVVELGGRLTGRQKL
jgi:hypothetical protein